MSDITTYEIPAENLPGLMFKLDKLSKKSKKINGKAIDLQVLSENRKPVMKKGRPVLDHDGNQIFDISYTVTVEAEPVRIAGHTFIARIDHSANAGNILRVSPNVTCEIPEKYRTIGALCDHCGKIRPRRDTFLLRCDDTGELKQIGRQCIRDYIGYDPAQMLSMAEVVFEASPSNSDGEFEDFGNGMRDRRYILVSTYLAHVSAIIRRYGWASRKHAEINGGSSTASDAHYNMFPPPLCNRDKLVPLTEQDFKTSEAALAYAATLAGRSEYEHNLKVIAAERMIEGRSMGLLASLIPALLKHREQEFQRAERRKALNLGASQHVGKIGERLRNIPAVVFGYNAIEGNYGTTYIYKFQTDDGNILVWFSSQGVEGLGSMAAISRQKVILKAATVKKHDEYQEIKQTVVSRCNVEIVEEGVA